MADSLPSPPQSREPTPHNDVHGTERDDLVRRLDELLEQYLEVLDEYTVLREQLSKTFSDGFMSLAHAQRISNLGPGRRYGQDGYDGRMKALRRVNIERREEHKYFDYSKTKNDSKSKGDLSSDTTQDYHFDIKLFQQKVHSKSRTGKGNGESLSKADADIGDLPVVQEEKPEDILEQEKQTADVPKKSNKDSAYRDPVTWYGILVPPALRQSQNSFVTSVENAIPQLISAACLLQYIESNIWLLRKKIARKGIAPAAEVHDVTNRPAKLILR